MSDRGHNLQTEPMANAESFDLSELRGLREPIQQLSDCSVNLSQASIPGNNIHRVTSEKRGRSSSDSLKQVSARGLLPPRVLKAFSARNVKAQRGARNGIFTNPYYRYHGGVFARLITFLANLLKAFEQLLLGGIRTTPATTKVIAPQSRQKVTTDTKERIERERLIKLEQKKKRLLIHRSQD
jgi:hypothetical protein